MAAPRLFNVLHLGNSLSTTTEYIGYAWSRSDSQAFDSNTVSDSLTLGLAASTAGAPYAHRRNLLTIGNRLFVGNQGTGVFTQSGGTTTVADTLELGFTNIGSGSYTLNGTGVLKAADEQVGYNGTGSFTQGGGANTTKSLTLGNNVNTLGTYTLSGGTLTVTGNVTDNIGNFGTGIFNQTGGVHDIGTVSSAFFTLGQYQNSSGTYNLSGSGSLTVEASSDEIIGELGQGTFNQSGGIHTVAGTLIAGDAAGGTGIYNLSAGTLSAATEVLGNLGAATFNQTGGTHSATSLSLGFGAGSGTYNLSAGSLTTTSNQIVGGSGQGLFNQSGGANSVLGELALGDGTGGTGIYNLSAGTLSAAAETLGNLGAATFNQTGGIHTASILSLGFGAGSGTYNLSAGTLTANRDEFVGGGGTGVFNQSGGNHTVGRLDPSSSLYLGHETGSSGSYNLSGGILAGSREVIGRDGSGSFIQTGGSNTVLGSLILAEASGSTGTYVLSGGTLSAESVLIGDQGAAALTVSGTGVLTVTSEIVAGNTGGAGINFTGGVINTPSIYTSGQPSLFNWTGGTLNITSDMTLDATDSSTWTGAAFGRSLTLGSGQTLQVNGNEVIGTTGGFALTLNDGSSHTVTGNITLNSGGAISLSDNASLAFSSFTQAGGAFNGNLVNTGIYLYQGGQVNGKLINQGSAVFSANFTARDGIENDGNMGFCGGPDTDGKRLGLRQFRDADDGRRANRRKWPGGKRYRWSDAGQRWVLCSRSFHKSGRASGHRFAFAFERR